MYQDKKIGKDELTPADISAIQRAEMKRTARREHNKRLIKRERIVKAVIGEEEFGIYDHT